MGASAATLLRRARADAGLSRRALATKAGVPTTTVSRIEDAKHDPTLSMLERLLSAAGLELTVETRPGGGYPTIASLTTAVDSSAGRLKIDWTRLRGFTDWATRHPADLASALAFPPARTGTPLDAILAALAEQLADEHHLDRPRWTRAVGALDQPWSPPGTPRMRVAATTETPDPFKRRGITLARSALFRTQQNQT